MVSDGVISRIPTRFDSVGLIFTSQIILLYASDYDSDYDSIASENQPLGVTKSLSHAQMVFFRG